MIKMIHIINEKLSATGPIPFGPSLDPSLHARIKPLHTILCSIHGCYKKIEIKIIT